MIQQVSARNPLPVTENTTLSPMIVMNYRTDPGLIALVYKAVERVEEQISLTQPPINTDPLTLTPRSRSATPSYFIKEQLTLTQPTIDRNVLASTRRRLSATPSSFTVEQSESPIEEDPLITSNSASVRTLIYCAQ